MVAEATFLRRVPRAFTLVELVRAQDPFAERSSDFDTIESALRHDPRFVRLAGVDCDGDRFMCDDELFRFFTRLNVELAALRAHTLKADDLRAALNGLREDDGWSAIPEEVVIWGRSLGLVSARSDRNHYVFPLARVLLCLPEESRSAVVRVLHELAEERLWQRPLVGLLRSAVEAAFAKFAPRTGWLVQAREGLLTGEPMTLVEAGTLAGLSAQRVRQIEEDFWRRIRGSGRYGQRNRAQFLVALVCSFLSTGGSLVISTDSADARLRVFLCQCAGLPQAALPQLGITIVGAWSEEVNCLANPAWLGDEVQPKLIARRLESNLALPLVDTDVTALARAMAQHRRSRLTLTERVYLAMKSMGVPAHYTDIAEVHNRLFPEATTSVRSTHAALGRGEHGIVWIGIRGTYALEEWGYERPEATLFETVAQIVAERYERTGKPVPLTVIRAEIGKHRAVVKQASLAIAAYCNDDVRRVHGDCFVPRGVAADEEQPLDDGLDKVLRDFRQEYTSAEPERLDS